VSLIFSTFYTKKFMENICNCVVLTLSCPLFSNNIESCGFCSRLALYRFYIVLIFIASKR
ncbi:MAG: hypothetical protein SPJ83_07665, partial [Helicobacter sp.]|uniref:hypothetical protein n=1 Tax=Helicobacter sp. TaxID=218 RepID=UPI002A91A48A